MPFPSNHAIGLQSAVDPSTAQENIDLSIAQEDQTIPGHSSTKIKGAFESPIDSLFKTFSLVIGEMDFDVYFKENQIRTQGKYQSYIQQ